MNLCTRSGVHSEAIEQIQRLEEQVVNLEEEVDTLKGQVG